MATVHLSPIFNGYQGFGNTGLPLNGGLLYTYGAGTVTPAPTYTTSAGSVQNTNPIVLDSSGRPPQEIWLIEGLAYKFALQDSLANPLGTFDNITAVNDVSLQNITFNGTINFAHQINILAGGINFTVGTGQRFQADFSSATIANRLIFQSNVVNGNTDLVAIPNGSSTQSSFNVFNGTDTANSGFGHFAISNGEVSIQSSRTGVGTTMPLTFYCGNSGVAETMRLTTAQQVLIGTTTSPTDGSILRIGGLVKIDNSGSFLATRGAALTVNNTTFTPIACDTAAFNVGTYFATGTGRYTPPAGKYALMANAGNTGAVDQARWLVMIYKNGAVVASFNTAASGVAAQNAHISTVVDANGTDFFESYVWQNSGGGYTLSNTAQDTYFCGCRIG